MEKEKLIKYAQLLLAKGAGLQKNQPLLISCSTEGDYFAEIVAEEAYKMGASEVAVNFTNDVFDRLKYEYAPVSSFEEIPPFKVEQSAYYVNKGCCIVTLRSTNPDNLSGIDSDKIKAFTVANANALAPYRTLTQEKGTRNVIACVPGLKWAQKVFPDTQDPIEKMWDI